MTHSFVVAYISFCDNELHMVRVEAEDQMSAAKKGIWDIQQEQKVKMSREEMDEWFDDCTSLEDIKTRCFDTDSMVNVYLL